MKFSNEILMAYADGELDAHLRVQIETEMERDPELARAVAIQIRQREELQAKLHAAFNGALNEGVPERLIGAIESTPSVASSPVVDLAARRARAPRRWAWPQWTAIAASLLLGVFVGRAGLIGGDEPFIAGQGRMLARGALAAALTELPGGSSDPETDIQVGMSYLAKSGDYCRTFTLEHEQALAGLACRRDSQWTIDVLMSTSTDASGSYRMYRMAGAAIPAVILGIVEETMTGEPLDAEQEEEARSRGWDR